MKIDGNILKSLFFENWKNILIVVMALWLLISLCSCGSRRLQKNNVEDETKTEQVAKVVNDIEMKTETKTVVNEDSQELEITPIDTAKVLIINGRIFKNAKVKIVNTKTNTVIAEKAFVKDQTKTQTKAKAEVKKKNKIIAIQRKSNPYLPLLWLLLPFGLYLIWKYKYKLIGL